MFRSLQDARATDATVRSIGLAPRQILTVSASMPMVTKKFTWQSTYLLSGTLASNADDASAEGRLIMAEVLTVIATLASVSMPFPWFISIPAIVVMFVVGLGTAWLLWQGPPTGCCKTFNYSNAHCELGPLLNGAADLRMCVHTIGSPNVVGAQDGRRLLQRIRRGRIGYAEKLARRDLVSTFMATALTAASPARGRALKSIVF